jgi:hypothetical protein
VDKEHRHHKRPCGHKFSLAAKTVDANALVGVAIVGRPVARPYDNGRRLEVTRLCTDGTPNACSFFYGAAARATFALGYEVVGTYTLASEPGTSLRAAGWKLTHRVSGRSWSCETRPREDKHPTEDKNYWERQCPALEALFT